MSKKFLNSLTQAQFHTLLRSSLALFVERAFMELHPAAMLQWNWHLDLIASRLEDVFEGRTTRLIINIPPRSLKSIMASVALPAYALGLKPSLEIVCASYGQDLSDALAADCRRIMQSGWYEQLFGPVLAAARPSAARLKTLAGGSRFATSVGGTLTGRGADILIIDDPLKPSEALSDAERNAANEWFEHTVRSRLNNKATGAIIIIMQRLHENDLVGHVIEDGTWEVLALPAIAEVETRYEYRTVIGNCFQLRRPGDVLHPERESREVLEQLRKDIPPYYFSGQYQQAPAPLGGSIFKAEWLAASDPAQWPTEFDQIIQSWDTANKESEIAAYSVCTTLGRKGNNVFVLHVLRERMEYPALKRTAVEQIQKFRPHIVLIEDKASGTQLIQELRAMGHSMVKECKPVADKFMRAYPQTAFFEGGFVKLPVSAPWLAALRHELTTFPRGRFNDQVDSLCQALEWIAMSPPESGILTWYRQEAARMKRGS